jgi:hypothetical protein
MGFKGTIFLANELTERIPSHQDLQYAFKSSCLEKAYINSAEIAIWADTRMLLVRPLTYLIQAIKAGPSVFLHKNAGWTVGQWTHDRCLQEFDVDREKAYDIPTVVSGFIAFDFTDEFARDFFKEFLNYCHRPELINGIRYNGRQLDVNNREYLGHRHDQSILGLMAHKKGLQLAEGLYADTTNATGVPEEMRLNKTEDTLFEWLP